MLVGRDLRIVAAPTLGEELPFQAPLLLAVDLVAFGDGRLAFQVHEAPAHVFAPIAQAFHVLAGVVDAVLGLAAPFPVLGDPGRFLEEYPELLRLRFDEPGDRPLLDDGVAARSKTGSEKHVHHVPAAALRSVEEVLGEALASNLAPYRDLGERGVASSQAPVIVVEDQFHRCPRERLAGVRSAEDDISHGLAAQMSGGKLAHHPAHRVDDVRLAASIRTDNADQVAGKGNRGGIDEGLEARQSDFAQAHLL